MKRIYLDHAATTPVHEKALAAMTPYFSEKFGNPSSIHQFGQDAAAARETAREQVALLIGASPDEVYFTSGGTEADNWAIIGAATAGGRTSGHLISSSIEHHAVADPMKFLSKRGFTLTKVRSDKNGITEPDEVKKAIKDDTVFASIMHANNEMGSIQPIAEISKALSAKGIIFHTDAVQTAGSIEVDVKKLGVDMLSLSSHKLYGPKGIGALYIRKGVRIERFMMGGGQERGKRAGTENIPAIVGFGAAAELARKEMKERTAHLLRLRDKLIKGVLGKIEDSMLTGHPEKRLPNNASFSIKFIEGESMLLNLDLAGIAASSGSACTSGSLEPSHVLLAMGIPHEFAHGSLRFTMGRSTTEGEIDAVLKVLPEIVGKLRAMSPLYKKKK